MRSDLVKAAEVAHNADPVSILKGGSGAAAFAIRFRKNNPGVTDLQVIEAVEREFGSLIVPRRAVPNE